MQLSRYAMYGVLFGFLFPLGAICLLLWSSGEWTFQQISLIHDQNILLWIIDTAPIFLGIFAAFGGYQKDKLERVVSRHEGLSLQRGKVLDSAFDGVIMLDKRGCVINFNKTCEAVFGYCKAEILGHKMADFIFPENFVFIALLSAAAFIIWGLAPIIVTIFIISNNYFLPFLS